MKLLVTGGCGFIGSNFIYQVLERHQDWSVINLDKLTYAGNLMNMAELEASEMKDRYSFVKGDICDTELTTGLITRNKVDAVVHFAAESHVDRSIDDPEPFLTTNVVGTQRLLEAARKTGLGRFVHVSTDEVYGTLDIDEPAFTEQTPLKPNSPYSASKASSDFMVRAYHETYGLDVVTTRCSNNYGPFQFPEKLIPLMFCKAKAGESLPVYGTGENVRDWIYVGDHCMGVELALTNGKPGGIYNFGGNAEVKNLDVVKTILRVLGKPEDLISFVKDRPGHDLRYAMDYSLAEKELGFKPAYNFESGMAKTLDWYEANQSWLDAVRDGSYLKFINKWYEER